MMVGRWAPLGMSSVQPPTVAGGGVGEDAGADADAGGGAGAGLGFATAWPPESAKASAMERRERFIAFASSAPSARTDRAAARRSFLPSRSPQRRARAC